jgi:hypothetical protein
MQDEIHGDINSAKMDIMEKNSENHIEISDSMLLLGSMVERIERNIDVISNQNEEIIKNLLK